MSTATWYKCYMLRIAYVLGNATGFNPFYHIFSIDCAINPRQFTNQW